MEVDHVRIVAGSVVPVAVMSACGLLNLAFFNRLTAVVSRLRTFQRERLAIQDRIALHPGATDDPHSVAARSLRLFEKEFSQVRWRARLLRLTILCNLATIGLLAVCSASMGLGVVWPRFQLLATVSFFLALGLLITGVVCAILEVLDAFDSIDMEARFVDNLVSQRKGT
jgi:hypothetical protein